jgi:putative colanic acid biosynthesis UDP-glucose lipid carrier transferase
MLGTYSENIIKNFESFTKRTVQSYFIWIITILFYTLLYQKNDTNKIFTIYVIFIFIGGIIINRFLYFGITNYLKINHDTANNVIILGYNETAKKLASYFEEEGININLIGFTEDEKNMTELTHYPILSNINDTIKTAKENDVQEIFSTITPEQNNYVYTLMKEAENQCLRFKVVPNLSTFFSKPVVIDYIRDMPILSLRADPLEDIGNKLKKRIIDILISSFVAIFILWWMIWMIVYSFGIDLI